MKIYNEVDYKVAYAFCYIHSKTNQTAAFLVGSDDGIKVWINSELVHDNYVARGLNFRDDKFTVRLNKGLNKVLVKVADGVRDWAFVMEVLDESGYAEYLEKEREKNDYNDFLNCKLIPVGNPWDTSFNPGQFPELRWDKPYLVEKVMGKFSLDIRWFDADYNEVTTPENPGRYAYYAKGVTSNGLKIRRAGTMYCAPADWYIWSEKPKAYLEYIPMKYFDSKAWNANREAIAGYIGRNLLRAMLGTNEGAVLLSYLHEMEPTGQKPRTTDTPMIRDHDYHLGLKRKMLGIENKWQTLQMPKEIVGEPARVLRKGIAAEAGIKPETAQNIRNVCQQWFQESSEPFDIFVARHGFIIIHDAFGEDLDGKFTLDKPTPMASLTKLVTGVMFAQFVDQGLIDIDDPVGLFLPDFPVEGKNVLTLRHCFTHTSGLWGHEEWGGLHNPWLENVVANLTPRLTPGKWHNYNGMGYDLAGRVMEMVGGKSIFRLMRENFFDPLGLKNTFLEEDLGFSCNSTAEDFAKIGQLLLNKGSYGNLEYFSPETFDKIIPKPLNKYYQGIDFDWGIGLTWMTQNHPDAGSNGLPADATILSKNVIGHGSATSAILRVDLDNDLVIAQSRKIGGKAYEKYLEKLLLTIEEGLIQ